MKPLLFALLLYVAARMALRLMKPAPTMPRDEAARLLGLKPGSGPDAVLDAHRRLIAKVHPDAGGSAELAARINQARDTMLKP